MTLLVGDVPLGRGEPAGLREKPLTMPPRLAVKKLTVTNFRNYESAVLSIDERPVVLTGANGAGKTNLLEALSYLAPGRGLRRAQLGDVLRRGGAPSDGWAVAVTLDAAAGSVEIGTGLAPTPPGTAPSNRRVVRIDGADGASQADLAQFVNLAWLTPEMDRLFDGPASERRRFMDRLVYTFDAAHAQRLGRYERTMRERTRLLRGKGPRPEPGWLDALESSMAEEGAAVAASRRTVIARLDALCRDGVGGFPAAEIAVDGAVEAMLDDAPALAVEDSVRDRLANLRSVDADAGRATFGVHRSDLACTHVAKDCPADRCSTGEQKALLIRIVLASAALGAAERGAAPILLLDEIGAHLDRARRDALFEEILALGAQAWMTGTEPEAFDSLGDRAQVFAIADGAALPLS